MTTKDERDAIIDAARQGAGQDWRVFFDSPTEHTYAGVIVSLANEVEGLREALAELRMRVLEADALAVKDTDADGFTSAYHFKTGTWHRLLGYVNGEAYAALSPAADTRASTRDAVIAALDTFVSLVKHTVIMDGDVEAAWNDLLRARADLDGAAGMGETKA